MHGAQPSENRGTRTSRGELDVNFPLSRDENHRFRRTFARVRISTSTSIYAGEAAVGPAPIVLPTTTAGHARTFNVTYNATGNIYGVGVLSDAANVAGLATLVVKGLPTGALDTTLGTAGVVRLPFTDGASVQQWGMGQSKVEMRLHEEVVDPPAHRAYSVDAWWARKRSGSSRRGARLLALDIP